MHKILLLNLFVLAAITTIYSKPTRYFYATYYNIEDNNIMKYPSYQKDLKRNNGPYTSNYLNNQAHVFQNLKSAIQKMRQRKQQPLKSKYPTTYHGSNTLTNDIVQPTIYKYLKNIRKMDYNVETTTIRQNIEERMIITHIEPEEDLKKIVNDIFEKPVEVVSDDASKEDLEKIVNDVFEKPKVLPQIRSRIHVPSVGIDDVVKCSLIGGCV